MPNEFLGKDIGSELLSRIRKVDIDAIPNSDERIMTIVIDFASIPEMQEFAGQGGGWSGSEREKQWLSSAIYKYDDTIKGRPLLITTRTYKSTVFDERGMVAIITRYKAT